MHCVRLRGALLGLSLVLLSCGGSQPVHGMYPIKFTSTAVCNVTDQSISFRNTSSEEIVIEGVLKTLGTDPKGNFTLKSIKIDSTETLATAGILQNIHIPAGSAYTFFVSYTPQTENETHTSTLDIVYSAPQEGVVQINLSGNSTSRASNCGPSTDVNTAEGNGSLNGDMTITVERLALINSSLPTEAITTDEEKVKTPFHPIALPVTFNSSNHTMTLRAIPASSRFILPPAKVGGLATTIEGDTLVTSSADINGAYPSDGSLNIPNVPIHLSEQSFEADFIVRSLTTGPIDAGPFRAATGLMRSAGFHITADGQITGSPIDLHSSKVILVGSGSFTGGGESGSVVARTIRGGGVRAILLIEARVDIPAASSH